MCGWSADREKGQALVEIALVLLILLTLIWAIIEGARLALAWISVERAARAGARFAAVAQWSLPPEERLKAIRRAAMAAAPTLALDPDQIAVYSSSGGSDPNSPGAPGDRVRVVVAYEYRPATPLLGAIRIRGQEEACTEYIVPQTKPPCPPIPTPGR